MGDKKPETVSVTEPRHPIRAQRSMTVRELAEAVHGAVLGDGDVPIGGVASIRDAEQGDIVFAENQRFLSEAARSRASAVVAFLDAVTPDKPLIRVKNPRFAFAQILDLFAVRLAPPTGIHPTAVIGKDVLIPASASVGPFVHIGDRSVIGERCIILAGCVIGEDVTMGEDCILYPNVVLYNNTVLGSRVILHAGAVIGADGFGYVRLDSGFHKVPHVGNVVLHDDVEVGANTTIDRAKTGSTIIGPRCKIDNLVQIAHNVRIGADTVIASMAGIAGSVTIGAGVTIAGQVGIKDHVTVGDGAVLLGQTGVWSDVPPRTILSGCPGTPHRERLRQEAAIARAPELLRTVERLVQANADLARRVRDLEAWLRRDEDAGAGNDADTSADATDGA